MMGEYGMTRNQKVTIIVALITGICTIISAVIGNYIGKENAVNEVINQATNTINVDISNIDELIVIYNNMSNEISNLKYEKEKLISENNTLKGNPDQFSYLVEENSRLLEENILLNNQIVELQNQIQLINTTIDDQEKETINNPATNISNTVNKVSIFDLEPFQGKAYWFKNLNFPFSDETDWLIDMYGTEFHAGYITHHGAEKQEVNSVYFLDKKYSKCNVMMAWPRGGKNLIDSSAFIKFYSGDQLLYTSPEIKCGDKPIEFSFDISEVEKFSFELISVGNTNPWMSVAIIYPYFDLVE